eukprot:CAMPEP_0181325140 /NCGR_PEP_ID=MMETSP1101-20121128/20758_1 /TAXON_ID=46948 /ORGANISM="Rhodomonas abbreviata, Strain Caron Lab Isolate" /LENGTH=78 /DNA_ID=CAMNT_0023433411 /DNA_START=84 /DNA_END=320 /DNA_ORIENTATION=+
MWGKLQEHEQAKTATTQSLYQVKPAQQTTELMATKLDMGMGLPFNVNGNRRQMPWQGAKNVQYSGASATLSPLMPLGT